MESSHFWASLLVAELCLAAGFPRRVWAVVKGRGEVLGSAEMQEPWRVLDSSSIERRGWLRVTLTVLFDSDILGPNTRSEFGHVISQVWHTFWAPIKCLTVCYTLRVQHAWDQFLLSRSSWLERETENQNQIITMHVVTVITEKRTRCFEEGRAAKAGSQGREELCREGMLSWQEVQHFSKWFLIGTG